MYTGLPYIAGGYANGVHTLEDRFYDSRNVEQVYHRP